MALTRHNCTSALLPLQCKSVTSKIHPTGRCPSDIVPIPSQQHQHRAVTVGAVPDMPTADQPIRMSPSTLPAIQTNCSYSCSFPEIPTVGVEPAGTRCWWRSWLRHCATSRKVAGSIPYGVIGIFHWHNPSGRTMALGLTQPLTEMSTRNIPAG